MSTVLTIRDVPEDVKESLSREASERGQSMQAFVLGLLEQQARFSRNADLIDEIGRELAAGGGAGEDAPDASAVLDQERSRSGGLHS